MKCPHCTVEFHSRPVYVQLNASEGKAFDQRGNWMVLWEKCPSCAKLVIGLQVTGNHSQTKILVEPRGVARSPLPSVVPDRFAKDYREACLVG